MSASEKKNSFKDTLNLPHTDFPIRSHVQDDTKMVERWEQENLCAQAFVHNKGKERFILHDGPPYANGHIHLGHAYNKILKDIIGKVYRMLGNHVPITPGWDCHGLPIELAVSKEHPDVSTHTLKTECRRFAQRWIDIQRKEFQSLGVVMNFDDPYLTMDYGYEADTLRAFGEFVEQGYIERKNKTIPWCSSCQTTLANAEIEYADRKDPSTYVLFPLEQEAIQKVFPNLAKSAVSFVVWTTTPWTLPLNRAVLLKPKATYVVLAFNDQYLIVGQQLADALCSLLGVEKTVVESGAAEQFIGLFAQHPFIENQKTPIILDDMVLLDDGTACVHSAPGCGPEDYEVGLKHKLEIFSPVSADGRYTQGIMPTELEGMPVTDGQIWVLKKLAEQGRLLFKQTLKHSYPHCWRCRNGLIFRATKQWFCDLSKNDLKERALQAADTIATIPKKSINRFKSTIEGRLEWCLSRQRVWGTPIPALVCMQCDYTHVSRAFVDNIADQVEKHGIEYWDTVHVTDLLPSDSVCPVCKGAQFKKETDILDVWFDAGVSHYAVLKKSPELAFPADVYLEGKDQHRGWFQSSLLTSIVLNKQSCTRMIITHGYTVDQDGRKMSKSLGNVVAPQALIDQLGLDGLRLWACSIDTESEVVVSPALLTNVQQVFRKIRNTCRFVLSNLYDFSLDKDAIAYQKMSLIDRYALQKLALFNKELLKAYQQYDFTIVFHMLADYCSLELSSLYLDIVKDRLYVEQSDGHARRSAQTACFYLLDTLTKLLAPVLSVTAEQLSDLYQKDKQSSIHLQSFADLGHVVSGESVAQYWDPVRTIRSVIQKAIEQKREAGLIKHSLEAHVRLFIDKSKNSFPFLDELEKDLTHTGQTLSDFFKELLIVSKVTIDTNLVDGDDSLYAGLYISIAVATGVKCPRCWQWEHSDNEHGLCHRCQKIVEDIKI